VCDKQPYTSPTPPPSKLKSSMTSVLGLEKDMVPSIEWRVGVSQSPTLTAAGELKSGRGGIVLAMASRQCKCLHLCQQKHVAPGTLSMRVCQTKIMDLQVLHVLVSTEGQGPV
jgi:hypothetical protein